MNLPDVDNYYLARWEREHGWDYMNPPDVEEEETYTCPLCGKEIEEDEFTAYNGYCADCYHQVLDGLRHMRRIQFQPVAEFDLLQAVKDLWYEAFEAEE